MSVAPIKFETSARALWRSAALIALLALSCVPFMDVELVSTDPWAVLGAIGRGVAAPSFDIEGLWQAVWNTLAFALQAAFIAAGFGFILALIYRYVAPLMALLRSVHELFWALLILQLFGLSSLTGVLALAIPYSATFARVFAEIFEETPKAAYQSLPGSHFNRFFYATLSLAWPHLCSYFRYRLECALRASVVLGFVGLPTLGFLLEGHLNMGEYAEVAALLALVIALVLSLRWWGQWYVLWPLLLIALITLPPVPAFDYSPPLLLQLLCDLVPAPVARSDWQALLPWFAQLWHQQIIPGLGNTLVLGVLALVLAMLLALVFYPLISCGFIAHGYCRVPGHLLLVTLRSLPEILLAFLGLIFLGPSLLPGVLAIGLHNAAILAHLISRYSNEIRLRLDAPRGFANRYCYEFLPRIYRQFLAFSLYRWEVMLRETAILGLIGIPTLGFFIDSAFEEFRLDRALVLILVSALVNIAAEMFSRYLRRHQGAGFSACYSANPLSP